MPPRRSSPPGQTESRAPVAALSSGAAGARRAGFADPVVVILLLAGFFDGISGNPVGGVLLVTVGVALARSRAGPPSAEGVADGGPPLRRRIRLPAWVVGGSLVGYAVFAGVPARFSWPATMAVAVPGATVLALAGRSSRHRRQATGPGPAGSAAWTAVLVGIALWELVNLVLQPSFTAGSYDHPTLSVLADPALASHGGRSAALAAWLAAGWYLVER